MITLLWGLSIGSPYWSQINDKFELFLIIHLTFFSSACSTKSQQYAIYPTTISVPYIDRNWNFNFEYHFSFFFFLQYCILFIKPCNNNFSLSKSSANWNNIQGLPLYKFPMWVVILEQMVQMLIHVPLETITLSCRCR